MAYEEHYDFRVNISFRNAVDALDLSTMRESVFKKNNTIQIAITVICVGKI